jgi:hypothetical protein
MTHSDFNHLLASVDGLSPDQMRKLLRELESRVATTPEAAQPAAKRGKRAKPAQAKNAPRSEAEVLQHMMDVGLITRLPDTDADYDDPDDQPITIKGEPLSETVIRERR